MTTEIGRRHEMEAALAALPVMDAHTHLVGGHLGARGLHDVLLYHMVVSDLYAAGCPTGARLTQHPAWPSQKESHARIEEALPFLPFIRNTSSFRGVRLILEDLYGWREPIDGRNWRRLDAIIRERADDRAWQHGLLDRLNIQRTVTELVRREEGRDDSRLQYSLEWGMFARCQWGEHDTPLYELERCWGQSPGPAAPIGSAGRPRPEREIRTLADVHAAMDHYLGAIPYADLVSTAAHISTDIDYRAVGDSEMEAALRRRRDAGPAERSVYSSYLMGLFLGGLERAPKPIVFQFSLAAEPLPFETASRVRQQTVAQLGELLARHPRLSFQAFAGSRHINQSLCTLARQLPNLSLAGYWWHNFHPDAIRQVMTERLELLPVNKQVGFFSDAYCVEWAYAKAIIVRKVLARVLADKVSDGHHAFDEAVAIARDILFETPRTLLGMVPHN